MIVCTLRLAARAEQQVEAFVYSDALLRDRESALKICSIAWPNVRAIANANGRLGSYRPVSMALIV
jgi:hypothetical protein